MAIDYSGADNLEVMLEAKRYNGFLKLLVSKFSADPGTALDFGAGIGTFTSALTLPISQVTCVEPDTQARAFLQTLGYNTHADISEVEAQFDYIFSLNVLEHIEDDGAAARKLFERLKPGATVFIYVPAFNHLRTSMDDLVGHHRRYTRKTLEAVLKDAGFTVEQARYTDFLGYFATLVFKALEQFKGEPDGKINKPLLIVYDRVIFPISRILSVPFSLLIGKNVYAVARRPLTD